MWGKCTPRPPLILPANKSLNKYINNSHTTRVFCLLYSVTVKRLHVSAFTQFGHHQVLKFFIEETVQKYIIM